MDRNGRGFAKDIDVHPDGKVALSQVRYTTLPGRQRGLDAAGLLDQPRHQGSRKAPRTM